MSRIYSIAFSKAHFFTFSTIEYKIQKKFLQIFFLFFQVHKTLELNSECNQKLKH